MASPALLSETPSNPKPRGVSRQQQAEWQAIYDHEESQWQALYNWRLPWWTTWGQIAQYQKPYRYYVFQTANMYNQGLRKDFAIVDRTATLAGEVCAAGLMSTLTDPDRNWLELGPAIPNFELDDAGRQYYQDWTERLNYVYDHSNFYESQSQQYDDMTFYGTGVTIDYEDEANIINVFTPCLGEFCLGSDFRNNTGVFGREFRQTVRQIVEMFGADKCPPDVLQLWNQKGGALYNEFVVGQTIEPNYAIDGMDGSSVGVVPGGFTWREVYWLRGKKDIQPLSLTGFHEQPSFSSLWSKQGNEAYGRGVGEHMLGDTIQLQLETRQKAESIEKVNRPPMGADVSLMNQPASTSPGKITYMNTAGNGEKKFFPLYEVKPDIPAISADIQIVQERLRTTAYNDVFQRLMTLRQQMKLKADLTATEVEQLTEEALTRLGPMMFRAYGTLRDRVRRHMRIMQRRGLAPRKPQSLQGVPLKIEFISLLTEARRAVKTQSIARTMQFAGTLVGAWPEARYAVDPMDAIKKFGEGVGCPVGVVRSKQDVKKQMAAGQQKEAAAHAMQQTLPGAQAAKALSQTSLAPGNALSALVQPR